MLSITPATRRAIIVVLTMVSLAIGAVIAFLNNDDAIEPAPVVKAEPAAVEPAAAPPLVVPEQDAPPAEPAAPVEEAPAQP